MNYRKYLSSLYIDKIRSLFGLSFRMCVIIIFGLIPYAVLDGLGIFYGIPIWNDWQYHLAILWLPVGFLSIYRAEHTVMKIWDKIYPVMNIEKSEFDKFKEKSLNLFFKPYYLPISLVFAISTSVIVWNYYVFLPIVMRALMSFLIFIAFINAGIGFWGITIVILFTVRLTKFPIKLNPLNSDNYGGLSSLGDVIIEGTVLFSLGSLAFPLGLTIIAQMGGIFLRGLTGLIVVLYAGFILASFIVPVIYLKNCADRAKEDVIGESAERFIDKFTEYRTDGVIDTQESLELLLLFELFRQTNTIKEWPYSLGTIIKLALSASFPIIMGNLRLITSLFEVYLGVTLPVVELS